MTSSKFVLGYAHRDDCPAIMKFLRDHWSSRHVLGRSRSLMAWQHADGERYNFIIARTEVDGIVGILGLIPLARYDDTLRGPDRATVWLTTWKVRDDVARGCGLSLLLYIQRAFPEAYIGTVGVNASTRRIYEALGYRTGSLTRFALIRPGLTNAKLLEAPPGWVAPRAAPGGATLTSLTPQDFLPMTEDFGLDDSTVRPAKTREYVRRRYLDHPFYTYQAWRVTDAGRHAILVSRLCSHEGTRALRVVDMIGDPRALAGTGAALERLLEESDAEYLDFFSAGLEDELRAAGLIDAASIPGLVLPGHFEPFERSNVTLLFSLRGGGNRIVLCKGDADQDRPNMLADDL